MTRPDPTNHQAADRAASVFKGARMPSNPEAREAASWALDIEDRAERQRLISGHRSRRKPKYEDGYGGEDHTEADAWLTEQWNAAMKETP